MSDVDQPIEGKRFWATAGKQTRISGRATAYHTDRDCRNLREAVEITPTDIIERDLGLCKFCDGVTPNGGDAGYGWALYDEDVTEISDIGEAVFSEVEPDE